jgi:beta-glucanase (GH16 family)
MKRDARPPFHVLGLALAALVCWAGRCGDPQLQWIPVWSDEFEGPAGQLPSPDRWRFDIGTDWGNAQLEYDTNRPQNVSLDGNGNLAIVARKESFQGQDYTSGRINTGGLFEQDRGRFEARIRLPAGQGIWPAFWLLGSDFESVGWPACGEIDIMEYRGQDPDIIHGTLHGPGYSGGGGLTGRFELEGGTFNEDFHIFVLEWSAHQITWLVDGERFQTMTRDSLPSGTAWVFDHPFFIILNVAVGGRFVGSPDASTQFPQTMLVDWVRVFKGE